METIIVEIAKYTYIDKFFLWLGLSQEISSFFALVITFCIMSLLIYWGKVFFLRYKNRKASQDLAPYYDISNIKRSTKYFISTKGQNISPIYEDEPTDEDTFIVKDELISWFINTVFQGKKENKKFHLILADSGMGKTTFLINLYMKYHSIFNFNRKYSMKLLPFGEDDIIQIIREIAKNQDIAKNTILLLDAFDEYKGLLPPKISDGLTDDERFRKQLDEIFEIARDFRNVIITSRTQYFPSQEETPYELKIRRFDKEGFHKLSKLYISPFEEKEVRMYLNKKFGILKLWNQKKKRKAQKITGHSHKLMVRPMLLSYIDLLVDEDKDYDATFDIYDTLIKKWIEREGEKRKYDSISKEKFKSDLLEFSKLVAIEMYNTRKYSQGIAKESAENICKQNNLALEGYEITGQSLLTRDAAANWKFAHKSIYEFFLAENAFEDIGFGFNLDITSLDMTKKFIAERMDKDSLLYFFNYSNIDENIYISKQTVTNKEFQLILDTGRFFGQSYTKSQSILFCNKLNEKFGYKIHYDKTGKLLDENNNTVCPTKVKGFIFPTMNESKSMLYNEIYYYRLFSISEQNSLYLAIKTEAKFSTINVDISRYEQHKFNVIQSNILNYSEENDIDIVWPEWTFEILQNIENNYNLRQLGFEDDLTIEIDKIEKGLRLVFVNN